MVEYKETLKELKNKWKQSFRFSFRKQKYDPFEEEKIKWLQVIDQQKRAIAEEQANAR